MSAPEPNPEYYVDRYTATKCMAGNPAIPHRYNFCSLPPNHYGDHRAHRNHQLDDLYDRWPGDKVLIEENTDDLDIAEILRV